MKKRTFSEIA